ncbi:uncharacterized protein LOC110678141 [Aedes aegypti]|uniref:Uncharacterized protein n=1 Tax=Aedes aegypti TaxID=7159 RepID=A0A6I8U1T9_AEDAE|nr:uncharacterized protein LOC110678141 [Aedes aegypti]
MATKKTSFQTVWLQDAEFHSWLKQVDSKSGYAFCIVCACEFALSNMGKQALRSHMKSKRHSQRTPVGNMSMSGFTHSVSQHSVAESKPGTSLEIHHKIVDTPSQDTAVSVHQPRNTPSSSTSGTIDKFMLKNDTTKAAILWCLETVMCHKSLRAAEKDLTVMRRMFFDSQIASKVQLGRDIISYTILFGIAPYFKSDLEETLQRVSFVVVGFVESLKKTTKNQQMDLNIRFWDDAKNQVVTRYLTSKFLGRSRAVDLLAAFKEGLGEIPLIKLLQVSMDGPNVNWAFLRELKVDIQHNDKELLDVGSCGLHILPSKHFGCSSQMVRNIMERFMKIDSLKNAAQVTKDEVNDIKNHLPAKDVVLGFDTKKALKNASGIQEKYILQFRSECKAMLQAIVLKLMNRSPLTYPMTKVATCLDPAVISGDSKLAKKRFESMLNKLIDSGRISGSIADTAVKHFRSVVESTKWSRAILTTIRWALSLLSELALHFIAVTYFPQ